MISHETGVMVASGGMFATSTLSRRNTEPALQTCWPFNAELAQAAPKRFRIEAQLLGGALSAINPPRRILEDRDNMLSLEVNEAC